MRDKNASHVRSKLVGRLVLSAALAGTSYAALGSTSGVAHTAGFVNAAISKLQTDPHAGQDTGDGADQGSDNTSQPKAPPANAPSAPSAPASGGQSMIVTRARLGSSVSAKHGDWTPVGLTNTTWTQPADAVNLIAGTIDVKLPAACTGAFGNALSLSVDDKPVTFATVPNDPNGGGKTITMPFIIGTLSEPGKDTSHTLTAKFGSSCTRDGEDFVVTDVKVDVLQFR
jgi:hypothetical protein